MGMPPTVRASRPRSLLLAALSMGMLLAPGSAAAQSVGDTLAGIETPPVAPTLRGCRLPLPGGGDRDSGLASLYLDNQQGQPYLVAPSLTLRQTATDNVTLAPRDRESDFITQLIPALSLCRVGPRVRAQMDYQGQALYYWDDQDRNDFLHRLNADTTTTVIRDALFLDAGALYEQQPITSRGAISDDNALVTGNRTNAATLRASPYLIQDVGRLGTSITRLGVRRTVYDEDIPNVTQQSASFLLTSPPAADPVSWQAAVQTQRVSRSGQIRNQYFDDAYGELGHLIRPRLRLLARYGRETERFADGSVDRFGAEYWNAGFRWTGVRTNVEARYGRRFYGDSYLLSIDRRAARLTTRLSYTESQQVSDRFTLLSAEDAGLPPQIEDPGTGDMLDTPPIVVADNEVFIRKRTALSTTYSTGRSRASLTAFHATREFQVAEDDEERFGADARLRWQWLPRTAVIPRVRWERVTFRDDRRDILWGAQVSIAQLLGQDMQAGATVRHQQRSSNDRDAEYTENAIILELTRMF